MISFFKNNLTDILSIILGFIAFASIVVKMTPNTKDDAFLNKIVSLLDNFSVAKTAQDKEYIEQAKNNLAKKEEVKTEAETETKVEE